MEMMRESEKGSEMKGLTAYIYKHAGMAHSGKDGISATHDEVTIVGVTYDGGKTIEPLDEVQQVFEPSEKAPPVVIQYRTVFGEHIAQAVPANVAGEKIELIRPADSVGPMMGGCYIGGSDSRLKDITGSFDPIALHDRYETTAQYASYD